jgi:hypothetical protein
MLVTPALAFVLGVLAAGLVAVVAALLWWADRRSMIRIVVGFSVGALAKALDDLIAVLPSAPGLTEQAHGCRELCAALQRLVEGWPG